LSAYYAALNILGAEVLFSNQKVSGMLDPATVSTKGVERHHLFQRAFLKRSGESNVRRVNQIANMAFVEWFTNIAISDEDPARYWPLQREAMLKSGDGSPAAEAICADRLARQLHWHGLPEGWHLMPYDDFLEARRHLIAEVVGEGWQVLQGF
jgi:hypothetical protein